MNFEAYWQENRSFVLRVGGGVVLFFLALALLGNTFGKDVGEARRARDSAQRRLSQPAYTAAQEDQARTENAALRAVVEELEQRVDFAPRPGFRPLGAAVSSGTYLDAVARVRDSLFSLARRRGMSVDPTLGLPERSPTREEELSRYLDGLDLVDRLARLALEEGVERIEQLRIRPDPGLFGRDGTGYVELTRVEATLSGKGAALASLVQRLARDGELGIDVESLALEASRQRAEAARLDLVLLAPRVNRSPTSEEDRL